MTLATVRIVYILLLRSEKMEDEQLAAFKQAKGMFAKGIASFLIAFAIWNVDKCVPSLFLSHPNFTLKLPYFT